jgi:cytochrome c oxidase subunit 4
MTAPESTREFRRHLRLYVGVFIALLVGTVLTVLAAELSLTTVWRVTIALVIATAKALLVAGFFMHLTQEKKPIYVIIAFSLVFFAGLMFLSIVAVADQVNLSHVH